MFLLKNENVFQKKLESGFECDCNFLTAYCQKKIHVWLNKPKQISENIFKKENVIIPNNKNEMIMCC